MKLSLRAKFFLASVATLFISMLAADLALARNIDAHLTSVLVDGLKAKLDLATRAAGLVTQPLDDTAAWTPPSGNRTA